MKINLLVLVVLLLVVSCNEDTDIYKTSNGAYASKTGKFVAKFPTKPNFRVLDNKIGINEFQLFIYRSSLGPNKIFSVEHYDYPDGIMTDVSNEAFLGQTVSNYALRMSSNFQLDYKEPVEKNGLKGIYFVLQPKENAIKKGIEGMILGEVFKKGNRVYNITYLGVPNDKVDEFISSFTLLE